MPSTDRRSYDTGISQQVQSDLTGVISRLETTIGQRNSDVASAMGDFAADGVSEDYRTVEQRWQNAAGEVQQIITLVRTTLLRNDDTAAGTLSRARTAVQGIG
jgi:hypothetical protein